MRWGVLQRLEFIEFRLLWEGRINRKDIIEQFQVSVPQASHDLKQYKKRAPGNMRYDRRAKQYFSTPKFNPVLISSNANCYLSQLNMLSEKIIDQRETLLRFIPDFDVLHSIERSIDIEILKKVINSIRDKKAIQIQYQSLTRPSPMWRWISPHAFVYDGFRWHVRAHCEIRNEFRDFVLGRIISVNDEKKRNIDPADDRNWNLFITIKIAPHPDLSADQQKIIEHEFGMKNGKAEFTVRGALVYYVLNRFRLEREENTKFRPQKDIIIINSEEIEDLI
jgi:predicted DNA-binding transcriptional regulator YafY